MRKLWRNWVAVMLALTTISLGEGRATPGSATSLKAEDSTWTDVLTEVLRRIPPPAPPGSGGSRSGVCPITPGLPGLLGETPVVWSDRPMFVWTNGSFTQITVYPHNQDEAMWSQPISGNGSHVPYTGTALQPGQIYDWGGLDSLGSPIVFGLPDGSNDRVSFQIMEAAEHDRIRVDLNALESQLAAAGATAEVIALQKAAYFTDRQLWSDALQQTLSVANPSAELSEAIAHFLTQATIQLCAPPMPQGEHNG